MGKIQQLLPKEEKVSPDFLNMLRNSRRNVEISNSINQFVIANIQQIYKLGPDDELDLETGIITRRQNSQENGELK